MAEKWRSLSENEKKVILRISNLVDFIEVNTRLQYFKENEAESKIKYKEFKQAFREWEENMIKINKERLISKSLQQQLHKNKKAQMSKSRQSLKTKKRRSLKNHQI